ncbi:hypothetical protein BDZ91DRAFT_714866 [Kalaharituber pfeilii]|nr:hypothetical protein BDZ91DRAFT_714866 [Kalaharituber pfeilii]
MTIGNIDKELRHAKSSLALVCYLYALTLQALSKTPNRYSILLFTLFLLFSRILLDLSIFHAQIHKSADVI